MKRWFTDSWGVGACATIFPWLATWLAAQVGDWLVTGWFTPDYRPLAEAFGANLAEHGAPSHLFASRRSEAGTHRLSRPWCWRRWTAYPGKTLVLMDVDCIVRGDIEPVTQIRGDVGVTVIARNTRKGRRWSHSLLVEASSRVVVFRPTVGARAFAQAWADEIERSAIRHDENSMAWAFLSSPSVDFDYIDQAYSGREAGTVPDAVIVHNSAHDEQRRAERGPIKRVLRAFERRFLRTGRTRSSRLKGELGVLLKASA